MSHFLFHFKNNLFLPTPWSSRKQAPKSQLGFARSKLLSPRNFLYIIKLYKPFILSSSIRKIKIKTVLYIYYRTVMCRYALNGNVNIVMHCLNAFNRVNKLLLKRTLEMFVRICFRKT